MNLVLSLLIAGRLYRLGCLGCEYVSSLLGSVHVYPGLPLSDVDESIQLWGVGTPGDFEADVVIPGGLDVSVLVDQGHQLDGEIAELAILKDGDEWEDRVIVQTGPLSLMDWGTAGDAIHVKLTSDPGEDRALFPDANAVINNDTWGSLTYDANAEDKPYPWVIGCPGVIDTLSGTRATWPASPAYVVNDDTAGTGNIVVLVAGHRPSPGAAVIIFNRSVTPADSYTTGTFLTAITVPDCFDDLGRECALVQFDPVASWGSGWAPGDELAACWTTAPLQCPWGLRALERAGDVLRYLLERTSLPVDWARTAATCNDPRLYYPLAGFWAGSSSVWERIRDQLLTILPIAIRYGAQGLYPVLIPWPSQENAVEHIIIGRSACWVDQVEADSEDLVSSVTVRYGLDIDNDWRAEWTEGSDEDGARKGNSLYTEIAAQRTEAALEPIEADMVWSSNTASWIARWQSAWACQPVTQATVDVVHSSANPGDVVVLTSETYSERPFLVMSRRTIGGMIRLVLRYFRRC